MHQQVGELQVNVCEEQIARLKERVAPMLVLSRALSWM